MVGGNRMDGQTAWRRNNGNPFQMNPKAFDIPLTIPLLVPGQLISTQASEKLNLQPGNVSNLSG